MGFFSLLNVMIEAYLTLNYMFGKFGGIPCRLWFFMVSVLYLHINLKAFEGLSFVKFLFWLHGSGPSLCSSVSDSLIISTDSHLICWDDQNTWPFKGKLTRYPVDSRLLCMKRPETGENNHVWLGCQSVLA